MARMGFFFSLLQVRWALINPSSRRHYDKNISIECRSVERNSVLWYSSQWFFSPSPVRSMDIFLNLVVLPERKLTKMWYRQ
jgi:hypothetical protein